MPTIAEDPIGIWQQEGSRVGMQYIENERPEKSSCCEKLEIRQGTVEPV